MKLRASQEKILEYTSGKMGISAVPGSGKTWTLSKLAADIIRTNILNDGQEILIVTLVNSAVDNFYQRIGSFVRQYDLIPNFGYRVRTLHGLAHDIVRERPSLVGLDERFQIIDEREADSIREEVSRTWLHNHPQFFTEYLDPDLADSKRDQVLRDDIPDLVQSIALSFIRYAKDRELTPEVIRQRLERCPIPLPLAEIGLQLYVDYQRALNYRGAVDFDDLIRLALMALKVDHAYLERLQERWPYILEDEAQDSSQLQEKILKKLVGKEGNWVRVGDPNQAIYETFTTANPRFLIEFLKEEDVQAHDLPESGRSTLSIIDLANTLVEWTQTDHPLVAARDALKGPPFIEPTAKDDPQPNPPDQPDGIYLVARKFSPQEEIRAVADSLARYLPENPTATVAVLVPRNTRGFELANELADRGIPYEDGLLRSSRLTRTSAGALGDLLDYLSDPQSSRKLARVFEVWSGLDRAGGDERKLSQVISELIRKNAHVEDYLWPGPNRNWLEELEVSGMDQTILDKLIEFRRLVRRWQAAALLPVDQIVLTVAQDILTTPAELAISHKLALLLQEAGRANPSWRLAELTQELNVIARNERRFLGFSQEESGFNPDQFQGKAVIGTIHKAKGLEWDRVYLMSVNNYDFPSGIKGDRYLSEKWFFKGKINLEAEALAQIDALQAESEFAWYEEGYATDEARLNYIKERLRLFYVGITRAKKELIITWNTGRAGRTEYELLEAQPFRALINYWDNKMQKGTE